MNTLNLSTLQAFQQFSLACKIHFLKTCSKEFIRFRSECIVNLLQGNLSEVKRSHVLKHGNEIQELSLKKQLGSNEEVYFRRKNDDCSKKQFPLSSLITCLEIEQFFLLPLSVYNSSNNPIIVTKQELSNYKPDQTPTYHKDTLIKEINQQLRTSASPLANKISDSLRIKLSNSNTLFLDGRETGVLLKDFA